jgi:hypothetical protein
VSNTPFISPDSAISCRSGPRFITLLCARTCCCYPIRPAVGHVRRVRRQKVEAFPLLQPVLSPAHPSHSLTHALPPSAASRPPPLHPTAPFSLLPRAPLPNSRPVWLRSPKTKAAVCVSQSPQIEGKLIELVDGNFVRLVPVFVNPNQTPTIFPSERCVSAHFFAFGLCFAFIHAAVITDESSRCAPYLHRVILVE